MGHERPTVLVIDDDPFLREVAARLMDRLGLEPVALVDGQSAVRWARRRERGVDVLFLDLNMPGLDRVETLDGIRVYHPEVPAVVASGGSGHAQERVQLLASDPRVQLVPKPVRAAAVRAALEKLGVV